MADRINDAFFEESFGRDDASDLGGNWTQTGGALQILNQTARQSGASSTATASLLQAVTTAAKDIGENYSVNVLVASATDTATRKQTIMLRNQGGLSGDGYGLTLEWADSSGETLTMRVRKLIAGTWSNLASATIDAADIKKVSDSYDGVFQSATAWIYNEEGVVRIKGFLNAAEAPLIEYTDEAYPMFSGAGSFGSLHEDNDNGVDGHIILKSIRITGLQEQEPDQQIQYRYWTFGKIASAVQTRCLRGGQTAVHAQMFKELVNETMLELSAALGPAHWWKGEFDFTLPAGSSSFSLPPNTTDIQDTLWDVTGQAAYHFTQDTHARDVYRDMDTPDGTPYLFWTEGSDRDGGPVLRFYPPTAEERQYRIVRYRTPAAMLNDTEFPDIPERFVPALIQGSVLLYAMRDSDRAHIQAASAKFNNWIAQMRRASYRQGGITSKHHSAHAWHRRLRNERASFGDYPRWPGN